jgi:membrane associated rhomboid family serine protease
MPHSVAAAPLAGQNLGVGLEKRDYMHEPRDPGVRGRWAVASVSTKIIVLNVIVFLAWQFAPPSIMREHFLVSWSGVFEHGRVWTLLTAAFSHQGVWHIAWNMIYLHWFGIELEQIYGRRNFTLLYIYAALVSSLAHCTWAHGWGFDNPALGASGAVMAVAVVTAIFYPHRLIYVGLFPVPLWLLAGFMILGDFAGLTNPGSGVGHAAHLGGALAGAVFYFFDLRLFASPGQVESDAPWPGVRAFFGSLFSRKKAAPVVVLSPREAERERVDDILRKITREGMGSLTPEERAFLEAASRRPRG